MKSIRQLRALFGALALLCVFAPEWAAGTQLMTYQGRLKESGLPVSGNRNVNILFCNCLSGVCAPACVPSGLQGVAVSSGLFRTTFTVPASVELGAGSWYLEVMVGGSALSPREQLTAGPYAVHASSASGLTAASGAAGVSVSSHLFVVNSRLGVGTVLPQSELHVFTSLAGGGLRLEGGGTHPTLTLANGSIKRGQLSYSNGNDFLSLTGGKAFIIKGPGDGSIELGTGDMDAFTGRVHMIVSSNTRVGVGTLSPAARLHVSSSSALASEDVFLVSSGTAAGQELLVVKGGGNVGIGTTNPAGRLTVASGQILAANGSMGAPSFSFASTPDAGLLTFGASEVYVAASGNARARFNSNGLQIFKAGTSQLYNDSLHVFETAAPTLSAASVATSLISVNSSPSLIVLKKARGATTPGAIAVGDDLGRISGVGYVGATNQYIDAASILFDSEGPIADSATGVGGVLSLQTRASGGALAERMKIDSNGNVGIGTTAPGATLHVNGTSTFEGDVAITTGSATGGAHLRSSQPTNPIGTAPSPACGTGAPTATVTGTDMAGTVQLNTVTAPSGTCTVTVAFVRPYATAPKAVVITPMGPLAAGLNAFVQIAPTTTGFVIQPSAAVGPTTSYTWSYIVIE